MLIFGLILFYILIIYLIVFKTKYSLFLLLGVLPFQPFLKTLLDNFVSASKIESFLFSAWKEFFIVFLFLALIFGLIKARRSFKIIISDYLIIFLFLLTILSFILTGLDLSNLAFGVKYSLLFLLLYFSIRTIKFKKDDLKKIVRFFLIILGVVVGLSFVQLFLPTEFLTNLGYQNQANWQPGQGLQIFQEAGGFQRAFGPLSGPNQLGLYLSFSLLMIIGLLKEKTALIKQEYLYILGGLLLILIVLSFSRTAWLALLAGFVSLIIIMGSKKVKLLSLILIILMLLSATLLYVNKPETLVRHTDQTRIERLRQSVGILIDNPLGLGIGKVGPASQWTDSNKGIISENQYLQIGLELGVIGLIAYLTIFFSFLKRAFNNIKRGSLKLLKGINSGLFISLIGLLVSGLFLHSLTDATLIYTLAIVLGLGLNNKYQKST